MEGGIASDQTGHLLLWDEAWYALRRRCPGAAAGRDDCCHERLEQMLSTAEYAEDTRVVCVDGRVDRSEWVDHRLLRPQPRSGSECMRRIRLTSRCHALSASIE